MQASNAPGLTDKTDSDSIGEDLAIEIGKSSTEQPSDVCAEDFGRISTINPIAKSAV